MVARGVFVLTAMLMAAMGRPGMEAAAQTGGDAVFSPQTAETFVKTAREIMQQEPLATAPAMRFLDAAQAMDRNTAQIAEYRLRFGTQTCMGGQGYAQMMVASTRTYMNRQFDLELVLAGVRCMLTQLDTRVDREAMLEGLLRQYAPVNATLGSELATQLGLLAVEKGDTEGARQRLNMAYQMDPYNQLAFKALEDLFAAEGVYANPQAIAMYQRRMLDVNPYDVETALQYADTLLRYEIYDQAAAAYGYADRAFTRQFPDRDPEQSLYLPWITSCYHAPRLATRCLELADRFRDETTFDLMLEAIAGRAAAKLGRTEQALNILEGAAQKAEQMLGHTDIALPIYPEHLAWFYSFILERPDNGLAWSNQAFSQAPDRRGVKPIFGYTLAVNGQYDLAAQYAEPTAKTDQVAAITMALVRQHEEAPDTAMELLREAITMAPETFEAEKARSLLKDMGSEYLRPKPFEDAERTLEEQFTGRVVPPWVEPGQRFSTKLMFSGNDVIYGVPLNPRLVLENNSSAPLVIQDGGMLAGFIRVDVAVRGDVTMEIPNLLSMRFRPSRPVQPNENIFVPLDLEVGPLRRLLNSHPQASLDLEFTVYLDPVVQENGIVINALSDVSPIQCLLKREGVKLSREYLLQRLDALAKGQEGQKIQSAELFAGLLAEQAAMESGKVRYEYTAIERELLADAVRRALTDENWRLRVQTMVAVDGLSLPTNFALIQTLSANLNHEKWPVRFMALYLLDRLQKDAFLPVLDWTAQFDASVFNRYLAVALGGKEPPQPQREPGIQQEPTGR